MNVLLLAGSLRKESLNKRLARLAAVRLAVLAPDHQPEYVDFREFELPPYDGDLEAGSGVPAGAVALGARLAAAGAFVLATPEYNRGVPGTLKNAIDWLSRLRPVSLAGMPTLVLSASPGPYGAVRGAAAVKVSLEFLGAYVHPSAFALTHAGQAFTEQGTLADGVAAGRLDATLRDFVGFAGKLRAWGEAHASSGR